MWRHPWQSASVRITLTHLLSWMPQEWCTEIRSCLSLQSQLYSSYNSRTSLKDLIGISPKGSIYVVSELWSGPISDRELVIKSVTFCLSKKILSSHSQAVLPFNFFFFTFWLPSSVACWFAWFLHKHHVLSFQKNNSNHRIHKHCSPSIPSFFLTSFVFADSDGWFTSIMFSFKKTFFVTFTSIAVIFHFFVSATSWVFW